MEIGVPTFTIAGIPQHHDLINIPEITAQGIIAEIVPLYKSGHSTSEISKMLGVPKTSVRSHLIRAEVSLRPSSHVPDKGDERHSGHVRWNSPYGFQYSKGKLVAHPQEFEVLRLILSWSKDGGSYEEISQRVNARKLRPRSAKQWTRFTIRQIIKWHQSNPQVMAKLASGSHSSGRRDQ